MTCGSIVSGLGPKLQATTSAPQGRLPSGMEDFCIELLAVPAFSAVEAGFRRGNEAVQRHIYQFAQQKAPTARALTHQSERTPEPPKRNDPEIVDMIY